MVKEEGLISFEWDEGNIDKSYKKHGITLNESEEIFLDENIQIVPDFKHHGREKRFIAIGSSFSEKILFVVFTMRSEKIRIISARKTNKKERRLYEEKVKNNSKI